MKNFFSEFKKFITRGNALDLAVGVIVGSAFTAIVTALTKNILQPLINALLYVIAGKSGSLENVYTFLVGSAEDMTTAIYIDWGAFIGAIINFILVALVLFLIIRTINRLQQGREQVVNGLKKNMISKEDRMELKKRGVKIRDEQKVKEYFAEKERIAKAEQEQKEKEEAEKLQKERELNPTSEDLLKKILTVLESKK